MPNPLSSTHGSTTNQSRPWAISYQPWAILPQKHNEAIHGLRACDPFVTLPVLPEENVWLQRLAPRHSREIPLVHSYPIAKLWGKEVYKEMKTVTKVQKAVTKTQKTKAVAARKVTKAQPKMAKATKKGR